MLSCVCAFSWKAVAEYEGKHQGEGASVWVTEKQIRAKKNPYTHVWRCHNKTVCYTCTSINAYQCFLQVLEQTLEKLQLQCLISLSLRKPSSLGPHTGTNSKCCALTGQLTLWTSFFIPLPLWSKMYLLWIKDQKMIPATTLDLVSYTTSDPRIWLLKQSTDMDTTQINEQSMCQRDFVEWYIVFTYHKMLFFLSFFSD